MLRLQRAGSSAVKILCLLQKLYHVDLRSQQLICREKLRDGRFLTFQPKTAKISVTINF